MLQIVLAKARPPRSRWPSRSGARPECHHQGTPSAAQESLPRPPHQARVTRHIGGENGCPPAFDASCGQGGAPKPRRPIRSSAPRAHSNGKREGRHSPSAERRLFRPTCFVHMQIERHDQDMIACERSLTSPPERPRRAELQSSTPRPPCIIRVARRRLLHCLMIRIAPGSTKSETDRNQVGDGLGNNRITVEQSTSLGSGWSSCARRSR
jgi:hypothetical protein